MKQVWVIKKSYFEPETKPTNGVRKELFNQKSPGKKRRALKPQASCSNLDQKSSEDVRYALKPILKWSPKSFC